jgi:hypothetical protein
MLVPPSSAKLPDGRALTEDRASDTQVSCSVTQCVLQIAAHPGRDRARPGVSLAQPLRDLLEGREGRIGVHAERRHRHHPGQVQSLVPGDLIGQGTDALNEDAAAGGVAVQADLDEAPDDPPGLVRTPAERHQ